MQLLEEAEPRERVEAVERAIALLRCFRLPGEALTLAALAERSCFYKSTILRLAASLTHARLLLRDPDGRFRLGPELRRLGALSQARVQLEPIIRPVLRRLTLATSETASFYVRDGETRVCRYRENSPLSARHHLEEGTRHPLAKGAAGAVLRLHGSRSGAGELLRRTGAVVSRGGRDPDLAAVAVPVCNGAGELIGALTVSGLIGRFTQRRIDAARRKLLDAAAGLAPLLPASAECEP